MNISIKLESLRDKKTGISLGSDERQAPNPDNIPCSHHFICMKCHAIEKFNDHQGMWRVPLTRGFYTLSSQVFNYGYCDDCRPQGQASS